MRGKGAYPSIVASNKQSLADWRAQLAAYVKRYIPLDAIPHDAQFAIRMEFMLRRPASHYLPLNSKRTLPELRATAPVWVTKAPDIDKLVRAVLDASTDAGIWDDDSQAVYVIASKKYANSPNAVGVTITYSQENTTA